MEERKDFFGEDFESPLKKISPEKLENIIAEAIEKYLVDNGLLNKEDSFMEAQILEMIFRNEEAVIKVSIKKVIRIGELLRGKNNE